MGKAFLPNRNIGTLFLNFRKSLSEQCSGMTIPGHDGYITSGELSLGGL